MIRNHFPFLFTTFQGEILHQAERVLRDPHQHPDQLLPDRGRQAPDERRPLPHLPPGRELTPSRRVGPGQPREDLLRVLKALGQ